MSYIAVKNGLYYSGPGRETKTTAAAFVEESLKKELSQQGFSIIKLDLSQAVKPKYQRFAVALCESDIEKINEMAIAAGSEFQKRQRRVNFSADIRSLIEQADPNANYKEYIKSALEDSGCKDSKKILLGDYHAHKLKKINATPTYSIKAVIRREYEKWKARQ